jgi:hypothetical protein
MDVMAPVVGEVREGGMQLGLDESGVKVLVEGFPVLEWLLLDAYEAGLRC